MNDYVKKVRIEWYVHVLHYYPQNCYFIYLGKGEKMRTFASRHFSQNILHGVVINLFLLRY